MARTRLTAVLLGVAIVSFLAPARAMQPGGAGGMMGGQGMGGGGGNPGGGGPGGGPPILDLSKNSGMPPGLGGMQAQGQGAGGMPPMGGQAPPPQQQQQQPPQGVAPNAATLVPAQTNTMAAGGMGAAGGLGQATQMGAANMAHSQSASPALQIIPVQQINAQVRTRRKEEHARVKRRREDSCGAREDERDERRP